MLPGAGPESWGASKRCPTAEPVLSQGPANVPVENLRFVGLEASNPANQAEFEGNWRLRPNDVTNSPTFRVGLKCMYRGPNRTLESRQTP